MNPIQPILKQLFAAYPHTEIADGTVAVYARALSDVPPEELQAIVDRCVAEYKFLPSVSEILAARDRVTHSTEWVHRPQPIGFTVGADGWDPLYLNDADDAPRQLGG